MNEQLSLLHDPENIVEHNTCPDMLKSMPEREEVYNSAWKCWYVVQDHDKIMCSISGGYDSDIMQDMLIRCGARGKTTFIFNDTGLEYDATKEHIKDLEERYHIKVLRLRPKKSIPACCKEYGVPFWSKYVSEMIYRLQKHGFQWEDEPLDALIQKYPKCRAALRWWCNYFKADNGRVSRFNIEYVSYLKEFMIAHPPKMQISAKCCEYAKKAPAHTELKKGGYDLNCTGVRKAEGGARATSYRSCFDDNGWYEADNYRPLFWWSDADKEAYRKHFGLRRSDCYEVWGMERTGCAGCPFGKDFDTELALVQKFEPKRYRAMISVFGESYDYTREFMAFREKMKKQRRETDENQTKLEGVF